MKLSEMELAVRKVYAEIGTSNVVYAPASHTDGPWKVHPYLNQVGPHNVGRDVGPSGISVAIVIGQFDSAEMGQESEANAVLIASAPEFKIALEEIFAVDGERDLSDRERVAKMTRIAAAALTLLIKVLP